MKIIQLISDSQSSNNNYYFLNSMIAALCFTMLLSCLANKSSTSEIIIKKYIISDSIYYKINTAEIINNNLVIEIEYYGNKKDEFDLLFSGKYKKSYPPIVNLYLDQKIKSAKKYKLKKKLTYNLSKIKYPNTESTIIYLHNYNNALKYNH